MDPLTFVLRRSRAFAVLFTVTLAALSGCERRGNPLTGAAWVSLANAEATYGPLVTAGNHPTPDQHGTGERVGLFQDAHGTVWGLPLTIESGGVILVCAPPALRSAGVTDTFPAGSTVIGATNVPTGWRGGTGNLELLFREDHGAIHRQVAAGSQLKAAEVCQAPEFPGPPQRLDYYRLIPSPQ